MTKLFDDTSFNDLYYPTMKMNLVYHIFLFENFGNIENLWEEIIGQVIGCVKDFTFWFEF